MQQIKNKQMNFELNDQINQYFKNTNTIEKKIFLIQYDENIKDKISNTQELIINIDQLIDNLFQNSSQSYGIHKAILYIPCINLLKKLRNKTRHQQFSDEQCQEYQSFVNDIKKEAEF